MKAEGIFIIIIFLMISAAVGFERYLNDKKDNGKVKVVQDSLIEVSNPEKGLCKFKGHTLNEWAVITHDSSYRSDDIFSKENIYYLDTCCRHAMGDTVEVHYKNILK